MTGLRVVVDCNVFLQALSRTLGPVGRCFSLATNRDIVFCVSTAVLDELRDVFFRPTVARKLRFTSDGATRFLRLIELKATFINDVPPRWTLPRDPSDSLYIDLAIAADAALVVTRDLDLLDLMNDNPAGRSLRAIAPALRIVTPPQLLRQIDTMNDAD